MIGLFKKNKEIGPESIKVQALDNDYYRQLEIITSNLKLGIIDKSEAQKLYRAVNDNAMKLAIEKIDALEESING